MLVEGGRQAAKKKTRTLFTASTQSRARPSTGKYFTTTQGAGQAFKKKPSPPDFEELKFRVFQSLIKKEYCGKVRRAKSGKPKEKRPNAECAMEHKSIDWRPEVIKCYFRETIHQSCAKTTARRQNDSGIERNNNDNALSLSKSDAGPSKVIAKALQGEATLSCTPEYQVVKFN